MRYGFVFVSIFAIWVAVIAITAVVSDFPAQTAHLLALIATLILFVIGFRRGS